MRKAIEIDSNEFLMRRHQTHAFCWVSNLLTQTHTGRPCETRHALLFDHMSTRHDRGGKNDSQRPRGLRVDDKFKIAPGLDWQVARFRPHQDFVDIICGAPIKSRQARAIGDEATGVDKIPKGIDGGQPMRSC
jgi:hypothetical protein